MVLSGPFPFTFPPKNVTTPPLDPCDFIFFGLKSGLAIVADLALFFSMCRRCIYELDFV